MLFFPSKSLLILDKNYFIKIIFIFFVIKVEVVTLVNLGSSLVLKKLNDKFFIHKINQFYQPNDIFYQNHILTNPVQKYLFYSKPPIILKPENHLNSNWLNQKKNYFDKNLLNTYLTQYSLTSSNNNLEKNRNYFIKNQNDKHICLNRLNYLIEEKKNLQNQLNYYKISKMKQPDKKFYSENTKDKKWCNKEFLDSLKPFCFCSNHQLIKKTIICFNIPNQMVMVKIFQSSILSLNSLHKIKKLRIFNSTIDQLNSDSLLPEMDLILLQIFNSKLKSIELNFGFHKSLNNLKKLDLSKNELEVFPFDQVRYIKSLIILKLSSNFLKLLPDKAFNGCNNLRILDLSYNSIDHIGNNAFSGAISLKYLDLSFNRLKVLNNYALAFSHTLFQPINLVNLSNNDLRFVSLNAFENINVNQLKLNKNLLTKFPENIFNPILLKIKENEKKFSNESSYQIRIRPKNNLYKNDLHLNKEIKNFELNHVSDSHRNKFWKNCVDEFIEIYNFEENFQEYISLINNDDFKEILIEYCQKLFSYDFTSFGLNKQIAYEFLLEKILQNKTSLIQLKQFSPNSNSFNSENLLSRNQQNLKKEFNFYGNITSKYKHFFIDVTDNNFQCGCLDFEWIFKLKKKYKELIVGFFCNNLSGLQNFLNLDQLTLEDINC